MKTDNPSLAKIVCTGCNGQADIKRKRTGKNLLYLHCKKCGLDQRSGEYLQRTWQNAIDGITEPVQESSAIATEIVSEPVTEIITESTSEITPKLSEQEWQPTKQLPEANNDSIKEQARPEPEGKEQTSGGSGAGWLATIIGLGLVIAKIRS